MQAKNVRLLATNRFKYERNSGLGRFRHEESDGLLPGLADAQLVACLIRLQLANVVFQAAVYKLDNLLRLHGRREGHEGDAVVAADEDDGWNGGDAQVDAVYLSAHAPAVDNNAPCATSGSSLRAEVKTKSGW